MSTKKVYIVMQENINSHNAAVSEVFTNPEQANSWAQYMYDPEDNYIFYVVEKRINSELATNYEILTLN